MELISADSALATARIQEDDLSRTIRAGKATTEQVSAYPSAVSLLQSAQSACQSELNELFNAGSASLTSAQRTILGRIRDNRQWELPVAYLVVNRTEPEWVALREALANERIAAQSGEATDPAAAALLTQVRNDATVSAALASLDANLAAVQSAWQQAVFGE